MNLPLIRKLLALLWKERMEYRADFILNAGAQILSFGAEYAVVWMLLKRFTSIGGWTWPEIALLFSIALLTYAFGASISFVQMRELESKVRDGSFDGVLIKPLNPYFYTVMRGFNLGYVAHFILSVTFLLWSLSQLSIDWTIWKGLYLLAAIISGALLQAGLMTLIGAWTFVFVRSQFLFTLFFRFKDFISYPLTIYSRFIQILLVFLIPFGFVNFFPSTLLLAKPVPAGFAWGTWAAPFAGPLVYALGYFVWMKSINRYQGTGN